MDRNKLIVTVILILIILFSACGGGAYPITEQNDGNGTAEAVPNPAKAGDIVTVTATPKNDTFEFDKWDIVVGDITVPDTNPVQFIMPEKVITIKAVFKIKQTN